MRSNQQTITFYYFHYYAVKDGVDIGTLSDAPQECSPTIAEVIQRVQQSQFDEGNMFDNFVILLARMLCDHVTYFKENFRDVVDHRIPHLYSKEMSRKSKVVS